MSTPKIRLVAIDLDGTLLRGEALLPEAADVAAIAEVIRGGVTVAIATGRPHISAERFVAPLGLGETPLISFNGAMVRMPGARQPMFHLALPAEVVPEVLQAGVERRWHLHYFVGDKLFVPRMSHWSWLYQRRTGIQPLPVGDLRKLADRAPTKIIIMHPPEQVPALAAELRERWQGRAYVTVSQPEMVEIMHPEVNKGAAFQWLARHLGVAVEETMALGDAPNDAPLLEAAGLGVAMPQPHPELAAAADVVMEESSAPVAAALQRFVLDGQA